MKQAQKILILTAAGAMAAIVSTGISAEESVFPVYQTASIAVDGMDAAMAKKDRVRHLPATGLKTGNRNETDNACKTATWPNIPAQCLDLHSDIRIVKY